MLLLHITGTLLPVFAVIAAGWALTRKGLLTAPFHDDLNRLVYWVCLPALIVPSLDKAREITGEPLRVIGVFYIATFCVIAVALLAARLRGLERRQYGTFVQGSYRGNLAYVGIPLITYALRGEDPATLNAALAQAVFVFAPLMILFNVAAVILLVGSHDRVTLRTIPRTLTSLGKNPLIMAAVAGLLLYALPVDLPGPVADTLEFVGRMAAPASLFCVGGGMALTSMEGRYRSATMAACLKVFLMPALAWLVSLPFGLSPVSQLILMVYAATPTAVASYVMTKQLNGDAPMASGAIVISTVLSVIPLGIVAALF